jgi:hypothetical protein
MALLSLKSSSLPDKNKDANINVVFQYKIVFIQYSFNNILYDNYNLYLVDYNLFSINICTFYVIIIYT